MNIDISKLSYEELFDLTHKVAARMSQLAPAYREERNKKSQEERKERELKKKDFEKNELPKIKNYLFENLVSNYSVIKVKGARDGKGIKLFLAFNGKNGNILECRQIRIDRVHNGKKFVEMPELGQITQHMIDKVTHIKVDGEFVKIVDLIEKPKSEIINNGKLDKLDIELVNTNNLKGLPNS